MKYIDANKLIAEIERRIEETKSMKPSFDQFWAGQISAFKGVRTIIASLQQEQREVQNGKFVFPKCLYARTKDNKTIDMSYAPQDMTAVEYIRNDFVEQEQPGNKEKIMNFFDAIGDCGFSLHDILLLKSIWKEAGYPLPKPQIADASKMEQPEVDLEKEYKTWWNSISGKINIEHIMEWYMHETAHHFYELGRARKEE